MQLHRNTISVKSVIITAVQHWRSASVLSTTQVHKQQTILNKQQAVLCNKTQDTVVQEIGLCTPSCLPVPCNRSAHVCVNVSQWHELESSTEKMWKVMDTSTHKHGINCK